MARCMIFASGLALNFWGDAVQYAACILDRTPTSANPSRASPLEMLTGVQPQLADIVVFGSACTAYRDPGKKAWKPRAEVGMIIGKDDESKGYKVYLPHDRIVIVTQHVQNVETLNAPGNEQLQAQLRREGTPNLVVLCRNGRRLFVGRREWLPAARVKRGQSAARGRRPRGQRRQ
ncbi:hypothetical protein PHYSODRAFT_301448 [Phytophthora sojae]|uniref:Retroviral polymerase SH3-like domain-containing protein n=1 Tax=Phytophthora sojae (strain P6497) TaxID=1094619 RepID=G4ZDU7_PHYSP|nr:hypothetical protein PHYSODRAFT_301448 [Phytophthora sojae]EGZ19026.1 hypothetical protein PHYSODRAFT_301448 [Phytophthora sojae]|eukprot:XP_009528084.1 hypothetical protein PHYSODRAFT_301448 [Phytophthora sojae]